MPVRDDIAETRIWSRHIVRWQMMVNNLKASATWQAWAAAKLTKIYATEAEIETMKQQVEKVHKALLDNGW